DGHHMLDVAGGLPLAPELLAAAGEEAGPALVNGDGQALCVHVGQGQDLLGVVVLDDGGDQAVCVKFQIHGAV
ncbi:Maff2 family, partial [Dysosmobacter welbionis]